MTDTTTFERTTHLIAAEVTARYLSMIVVEIAAESRGLRGPENEPKDGAYHFRSNGPALLSTIRYAREKLAEIETALLAAATKHGVALAAPAEIVPIPVIKHPEEAQP